MKSKFITEQFKYDGAQLTSLFAYMNYELMGDSVVAWVGPCDIPNDKMVDGEDLLLNAEIRGSLMLHFIIEKFDISLFAGVGLQRLFASLALDLIKNTSSMPEANYLFREGDDIYLGEKKLSISIATVSPTSTLIHFALNISNEGTPVKTLSLEDLNLEPKDFAEALMDKFITEVQGITEATQKVKWVK